MLVRALFFCILGSLLAGCAANPDARGGGYLYHDATHPNTINNLTPQARGSSHGIWLWPPAENGRPG